MKKTLLFSIFLLINFHSFGQSILITPEIIDKKHSLLSEDIKITKYEDSPTIIGIRANGTVASPQKVKIGNDLLFIGGRGYNGSTTDGSSSSIRFFSTQDWMPNFKGSAIIFETTANNSKDRVDRMIINHDGKVGIGLTSPNQILDVNGRMRIRHTPGYTSGVWMSNSTNGLGDGDGAFIGLNTDNQAGIYIGNAWRFGFNSNGNAVITGFTQLGNTTPAGADASATAPTIKTMLLTGTTASTEGDATSVTTGLLDSKILSFTALVEYAGYWLQPEYSQIGGLMYTAYLRNGTIYILNSLTQSESLLNKSFKVLVTYTE